MTDDWRVWKQDKFYGDLMYKRATGTLDEMESSKALCKILSHFYEKGMKVLDIGCGAGHYLRSLRLRIDENIDYTGVDATEYYVELARKAFGDASRFLCGDIYNLQFKANSFDIVICNNLLLHLPPPTNKTNF
ncbi:class I SAM-dependent methyltransferase [Chloroflexota bacterium]